MSFTGHYSWWIIQFTKGQKTISEKITFAIELFPLTLHASVTCVWATFGVFCPCTNWLKEILNNRIQLRFKECKSFASLRLSRLELLMQTRPCLQGRRVARMQTLWVLQLWCSNTPIRGNTRRDCMPSVHRKCFPDIIAALGHSTNPLGTQGGPRSTRFLNKIIRRISFSLSK